MRIEAFEKSYDGRKVLSFPGLDLEKGKIYAFIGANGSGKTTCAKVISGIEKADRNQKVCQKIVVGYMPQKSFAFRMSLTKNILLNGSDRAKADELIKKLNLEHVSSSAAKKLSGGETAKMALARLMMKRYDILVLDEPTASMDMESTLVTEQLINDYTKRENCAIILITHSVQQAKRIADYVLYFEHGELEDYGSAKDVLTETENNKTKKFLEFYGV